MDVPAATDETITLTTKDGRRLTLSNRMLLQRTTNNKTTESYHYDADGNLTGAEADVSTWEERNTEIYSWINDVAPPPLDVHRRPLPLALQPPRSRPAPSRSADDPRLVRMASAVHRVPALAWSGLTASTTTTATSSSGDEQQRELTARVSGRQRSQSEHSVSMKTSVQTSKPSSSSSSGPRFQPSKAPVAAAAAAAPRVGKHVWVPPTQARPQPAPVVANGPLKGRAPAAAVGGVGGTTGTSRSIGERRQTRCIENERRRKQTQYRLGVDY